MKIAVCAIAGLSPGKHQIKDSRLDEVDHITKAKKKTYLQVDVVGEDAVLDAEAIIVAKDSAADLVLRDLEFVETRLSRATQEEEKALLAKLKAHLEKEEFLFTAPLSAEEQQLLTAYSVVTSRPVITATEADIAEPNSLLARALKEGGYLSFFTTGEKETRAWLIKKGTSAWEAAGVIHSDIQRGFIRAEIISFNDFISCGGETAAKQAGKLRLEQKEYLMQDADLANFRFNK